MAHDILEMATNVIARRAAATHFHLWGPLIHTPLGQIIIYETDENSRPMSGQVTA
jgi:hypothetical protein